MHILGDLFPQSHLVSLVAWVACVDSSHLNKLALLDPSAIKDIAIMGLMSNLSGTDVMIF
jgi:hypothetical protein